MSDSPGSTRPWLIAWGLVAAGCLAYLVAGDTPADAARETAARLAAGKRMRPEADFVTALWWAAALNFGLALLLMAGAKLWARPLPGPAAGRGFAPGRFGRGFVLALLAIVALAGATRWNLAHRSLWWDELWPVKFGVVGYYLGDASEPLETRRFADGSWQRSLWHYTRPTNHPAASLPARLSHVVWRGFARPEAPHQFSEFALRFFNWSASLGAVAAVGAVGALWGRPLAGLMAALVLALHPWHIRYGIDLRGYSWVALWTAMGVLWLTLAFRRGGSRWWPWWGFGLNQALLLWAFPHAVFVAAGLGAAALALVFRAWSRGTDRWSAIWRLVLVQAAGAMLFIQIFSPNLLQASRWYAEVNAHHAGHGLGADLARETAWQLAAGTPWQVAREGSDSGLASLAERNPLLRGGALLALLAALLAGGWRLARSHRDAALALAAPVAGGAALLGFFWLSQSFYYSRFVVFLVIPFSLLLGAACDWQRRGGGVSRPAALLAALALGGFAWLARPQWEVLMSRPLVPMRDVAETFASLAAEGGRPVIAACYGHGAEMLPVYYPELRTAVSLADLSGLAEEARERGARLLVASGYQLFNRSEIPDGFAWLDDRERFVPVALLRAAEPGGSFQVLEWTGRE